MEEKFFCGKQALIVGGTGGIGREISLSLAESGADLCIHGAHGGEKCDSLLNEISARCGKSPDLIIQNLLEIPFSELESTELFERAKRTDILCLCFGPFVQKPLHETLIEDWQRVALYDYALSGALLSAALPGMMERRWGRILLLGGTGTSVRREFASNAAYAGAKSALNVLLDSTAAFYADYGITCNMILPGFVDTEYQDTRLKESLAAKMPLKSMICPKSIAEKALFLMKNADINGAAVRVDRGWSALKSL
ncbi:MAG: SDR family oxidoreductase [Treponema sp.]|nr:SDR family oxidoreductase [Treponema sp.]